MRSEKKNTGLAAGAVLIAILIIIQIGDSYCSELYDKIQSLFSYGSDYESLEYVFRGCNGND